MHKETFFLSESTLKPVNVRLSKIGKVYLSKMTGYLLEHDTVYTNPTVLQNFLLVTTWIHVSLSEPLNINFCSWELCYLVV